MATETTPLRGEQRTSPPLQHHKRRIAGLAVFGFVMIAIAVLTTTTIGRDIHRQAIPQRPIKVAQPDADTAPLNTTRYHPTPAPSSKNWFLCGTENNEAGYMTMPFDVETRLFYWFFESRKAPATDPLVLWMTGGGSGCSSLAVLLTENGPCQITEDATTTLNPHSWTSEANVIWLDQPTNGGFSYGNNSSAELNAKDVQENVYWFLQGFLDRHPAFEGRTLYLAGEGYSAHYVPAAAHYIWSKNLAVKKENATLRINLQGITIGNGLVNPVVQMPRVLDMATKNSYNISLLKPTDAFTAKEAAPVCKQLLDVCQTNSSACAGASRYCSSALLDVMEDSRRNKFDIRKECGFSDPTRCYNSSAVTKYLNSNTVRAYLNVSDEVPSLEQCSSLNRRMYSTDLMKNFDGYIADLLSDDNIHVLVYSGDADVVCNWQGSEAWTKQLKWKYHQAFNDVDEQDFLVAREVDTTVAGSSRSSNRLTFLRVFKAGHMVPRDQPAVALEMINRFLKHQNL